MGCLLLVKEMRKRLFEMRSVSDMLNVLRMAFVEGPVWPIVHACVEKLLPQSSEDILESPTLPDVPEEVVKLIFDSDRLAATEDAIFMACKRWAVANDCAASTNPVGA